MIKRLAIAAVLIFFGLSVLGMLLIKDIEIEISQAEVQEAVDQHILDAPLSKRGITLDIDTAIVDFRANNTAQINIDFTGSGYGYKGRMRGDFSARLKYDEPEFFLSNLSPENMITELDPESAGKVEDVKNVATDFLKRQRGEMLSEEAKQSLDNIVDRNSEKIKEFAVDATYDFFESLPIYNLNSAGAKGSVATLLLKDVEFTEDHAIVTLSPAQAIAKILIAIFFTLMGAFYMYWTYWGGPLIVINNDGSGKS